MKLAAEELVKQFPELKQYYDDTTGLIDIERDAITRLIDAKKQELIMNALSENWSKAINDQVEAQKALTEATQNLKDAKDEEKRLGTEINDIIKKNSDANVSELQPAYAKSAEAVEAFTQAEKDAKDALEKTNKEIAYYEETYAKELEKTKENIGSHGESAANKYTDSLKKTLNDNAPSVKTASENIGSSVVDGTNASIKSNAGTTQDEVETWLDENVIDAAESKLNSQNSSRVFNALGKSAVDNFNLGITENTKSSITAITDWVTAISDSMKTALTAAMEEIKALWLEAFTAWNEENTALFFGYDIWHEKWINFLTAYNDINALFMEEWKANADRWWAEMVMPFFEVNKWAQFGTNMKDGIVSGFKAIVAQIGGVMNGVVDLFNQVLRNIASAANAMAGEINSISGGLGLSRLPHISAGTVSRVQIPALADGAVIRGGNPFMAVLGDQPAGVTNIETPLPTMVQAFKQAMRETGGMGGDVSVRVYLGEKDITKAVKTEADMYFARTGKGLFAY